MSGLMQDQFEQHIHIEQGCSAIDCLSVALPMSRQKLKQLLKSGAVWHESSRGVERIRRSQRSLKSGETLHVYYNRAVQEQEPAEARLIDDRDEYSIWFKPSGMLSQGSKWGDHCTLYRWAETHLIPQRPAFPVHRLDRATCGLMVLAHSKSMASKLSRLFETRLVNKTYIALLEGELNAATVPFDITSEVEGKSAHSRVLAVDYDEQKALTKVRVNILTGRKHQIRQHMASLGHPVCGDRLYGAENTQSDLQLCCIQLGFECPLTGGAMQWSLDEDVIGEDLTGEE